MDDFEGKVAVVTGAASGLGSGIATRLVELGSSVVLADVEREPLERIADTLGMHAMAVVTDVSQAASMDELRQRTVASFGPADVLFNNAGVTPSPTPIAESILEMWEWAVSVNLYGVVNGVRAFLPDMLDRGTGRVVNTASLLGITSGGHLAPYAASKAAVIAMSLALREEVAGSGVRVSVVFPHVASNIADSRRNWPSRLGEDPWLHLDRNQRSHEIEELTAGYVASGLPPKTAADMVLDGLRADRFWIFAAEEPNDLGAVLNPVWPETS